MLDGGLVALDCRLERIVAGRRPLLALLEVEDVQIINRRRQPFSSGCAAFTSACPLFLPAGP